MLGYYNQRVKLRRFNIRDLVLRKDAVQTYVRNKSCNPIEIGVTSIRREFFNEETNDEQLRTNLNCLDEIRDDMSKRMARY